MQIKKLKYNHVIQIQNEGSTGTRNFIHVQYLDIVLTGKVMAHSKLHNISPNQEIMVESFIGARNFSFLQRSQTGCQAHPSFLFN